MEKTGLTDRRVISKMQKDQDDLEDIDIWGEVCLADPTGEGGQLLRGHPTPDRHGEMFDWAAATFETADPTNDGVVGPAKLLAFCKDSNGAERAVVHATSVTTGRETKAGDTLLGLNNRLEFTQRGFPALHTTRVDQIDRGIMAFEHENFDGPLPPAINFQTERHKCVVLRVKDQANWAHLFFKWASGLPAVEIQPSRPDADVDCNAGKESDSSGSG